jgi:hypothetical protein
MAPRPGFRAQDRALSSGIQMLVEPEEDVSGVAADWSNKRGFRIVLIRKPALEQVGLSLLVKGEAWQTRKPARFFTSAGSSASGRARCAGLAAPGFVCPWGS